MADDQPATKGIDPTRLQIHDAARVLTKATSATITVEMIESDLAAGAPRNHDGSINLFIYGAWLARELSGRGR